MTKNLFCGFIKNMDIKSINFRAKPINKSIIKKYDKNTNKYIDYPATFVKLDADNYNDIEVIDKAAENWNGALYMNRIATASHWMNSAPIDIYALTTQNKNFDDLEYNKILGFAEIREGKMYKNSKWLYYLQVNPNFVHGIVNRNYKKTGTSILKSLKKIYNNITLYSIKHPGVEQFYKQNGFVEDYMSENHFAWSSNIFRMMQIKFRRFMLKSGL